MKLIDKDALVAEIENLLDKGRYNEEYDCAYRDGNNNALYALKNKLNTLEVKGVQEEPVSEELEQEIDKYVNIPDNQGLPDLRRELSDCARHFAKWQKQQDQSTIELAEDHAYFAGRTKTIEEIEEKLLSEVLPCFMHGGEADEVVAKLDEVLNQK